MEPLISDRSYKRGDSSCKLENDRDDSFPGLMLPLMSTTTIKKKRLRIPPLPVVRHSGDAKLLSNESYYLTSTALP